MKLSSALLSFLFFTTLSFCQNPSASSGKDIKPDSSSKILEKIDESRYQLGNVILDSKERTITLKGKINMEKGLIELLACAPGGKAHESVLLIDAVPYHIQVAMLLLGMKYKGGLEYQGDPRTPQGDSVEVLVSWIQQGKETQVRGEDLVWDIKRSKPMEHTPWIFVGSKMVEGKFMADEEKSLITTYHDPFTIFDNPLQSGGDDELYKVNENLIPAKGTPVTVIIKPYK